MLILVCFSTKKCDELLQEWTKLFLLTTPVKTGDTHIESHGDLARVSVTALNLTLLATNDAG